jgi:hypothetical protein
VRWRSLVSRVIDGDNGGGALQSALSPLMLLGAECYGFAASSFARIQIMQPSELMTRVRSLTRSNGTAVDQSRLLCCDPLSATLLYPCPVPSSVLACPA